ncbi:FKBP-type peptidyl-prolyl cis-trans isomerase [Raphidocelis subcapitata]|uniref:peptidylprolyl isomerase n=1 Tax=Raphidocelis subcapitata TaxID=307507 RepID=A0A2V0NRM1_9CHLO|nr:FKBP-type peptidyl-prolyl cis-trans isomerase [Raphidocelis subcapitata]|eukprot:GBF90284.1 FKBP-type peptidyl-prolyl cis-trans isomerase [Raphidocelis subcapitata]
MAQRALLSPSSGRLGSACRAPAASRRRAAPPVRAAAADQAAGAPGAALRRRDALAAAAAAAAAAASLRAAPEARAADQCELTSSPSGLQFCDLVVGEGKSPVAGALVRAHYTGRLASNGKVFDSSYTRGRPLTFKVGAREVIRGWDLGILGDGEGVPPMKEGGKRLLVIPSDLGYGDRGAGGVIPPGATLEFEVELLGKR